AQYSVDDAFHKNKKLCLITYVVNLAEQFSDDFDQRAHHRTFDDGLSEPLLNEVVYDEADEEVDENIDEGVDDRRSEGTPHPHQNGLGRKQSFLADIAIEEFPILDSVLSDDYHLDDPVRGLMSWTEQLFLESRSVDLRTFSGGILCSAFKEQSNNSLI
ncbi:hypothetical protein LTS18_004605, partial [Coniosporium uncinatum]